MNIYDTLFTAKQGMAAHQVALNATSQNVANVSTEGYSKKSAIFATIPGSSAIGGGSGVRVTGIKRHTDELATKHLIKEMGMYGSADQQTKLLTQVSEIFNDIGGAGLGTSIDNFFSSLRQLESSPEDITARMEVLARGDEMSDAFNRISAELTYMKSNIDKILDGSVEEINSRTAEIAVLNRDIGLIVAQGGDPSIQMDRREQLAKEIAQHANVSYIINDNQKMTVFLEGGKPLVEGTSVSTLQVNGSGSGSASVEYVSSNGAVSDITSILKGGTLGGALEVRDTAIVDIETQLNQLAFDLVSTFNTQHALGFGLDGTDGRDFFAALAGATDAASLMTLDGAMIDNPDAVAAAATSAGAPGDNRNAILLSQLADQNLASAGTQSYNEAYASLTGEIGLTTRQAMDEAALRENSVTSIETHKESIAGVSLDEEMVNLIQYQRSYEASARVLSVVDEVIQTLLNMR